MDVMISYSHDDTELMRLIKGQLKGAGLTVWVDEEGLDAGVDFLSKIGQAVVECSTFLSIVTPSSIQSKYCKDEVNLAYVSKRPIFAFSTEPKSQLFQLMDFAQKLTFSPINFFTVPPPGQTEAQKETADNLAKAIGSVLSKLIVFHRSESQKSALPSESKTSSMTSSEDTWQKLERFQRQNALLTDSNVKIDVTASHFWEEDIGSGFKCPWDEFLEKLLTRFAAEFEELAPGEEDMGWVGQVLKGELAPTAEETVSKKNLVKFCFRKDNLLWESVSSYVAEYLSIREVFSLDSTVRLDAIEKLKEYNSKAAKATLLDLTRDRDPNVRATAAVTLAKVVQENDENAAERLAMLLKDKDRLVRESACVALGRMRAEGQVEDIVLIWRNDVISTVREAALLALQLIDTEDAREAIHITKILAEEIKILTS